MSHNVTLKGISIDDFGILRQALEELNKEYGTKFTLKEGEVASRNYGVYGSGRRVIPNTVAVIDTADLNYDITLTRDGDGRVSMQTEAMLINALIEKFGVDRQHTLDISTGNVCDLRNATYGGNEQIGMQAALGRIVQRYGVIAAEQQAAMMGHTTHRDIDAKTGVINVVATGM